MSAIPELASTANLAVTPSETPKDSKACYLLVAVTDIRGFTSLTARVNQFCQSRLNRPGDVKVLSDQYIRYMAETQLIARTTMTKNLPPGQEERVVKSTGDGYMVAIPLGPIDEEFLITEESRTKAEELTWTLVEGVRELVENAEPKSKEDDSFSGLTHQLIRQHGSSLGIALTDYELGEAGLHVAGGVALGTGFFSDKLLEVPKLDKLGQPVLNKSKKQAVVSIPERDAFGHAANLAFRLCDKAGRGKDTPSILVDRRVGKLIERKLKEETEKQEKDPGVKKISDYVVRAYRASLELKGIEETWCMCYVDGKKPPK